MVVATGTPLTTGRGESRGSNATLFVEIEVVAVGKIPHDIVELIDKIACAGAVGSAVGEKRMV